LVVFKATLPLSVSILYFEATTWQITLPGDWEHLLHILKYSGMRSSIKKMLCVTHPLPGSSVSRYFHRLKRTEASEIFHLQLAGNTTRLNLILFRETNSKD